MLYGLGAGNHSPNGGMISLWSGKIIRLLKEDGRAVKRFLFRTPSDQPRRLDRRPAVQGTSAKFMPPGAKSAPRE